jgi:hypothetical protein
MEHACLYSLAALHEQHIGNTAGSVLLFRVYSLHKLINKASSYPHIVTDYRYSCRHRAVALLAPIAF